MIIFFGSIKNIFVKLRESHYRKIKSDNVFFLKKKEKKKLGVVDGLETLNIVNGVATESAENVLLDSMRKVSGSRQNPKVLSRGRRKDGPVVKLVAVDKGEFLGFEKSDVEGGRRNDSVSRNPRLLRGFHAKGSRPQAVFFGHRLELAAHLVVEKELVGAGIKFGQRHGVVHGAKIDVVWQVAFDVPEPQHFAHVDRIEWQSWARQNLVKV